jgi:hypothetical protein
MVARNDLRLTWHFISYTFAPSDFLPQLCQCLLGDYSDEDDFRLVHLFNKKPDAFNVDEYLKEREKSWK